MNAEPPAVVVDHLVIVAPSLEAGSEHVRAALGVTLQRGGEHAAMGTHNALLRLGDALYLEVIAVNPDAPPPDRPRWFELDRHGAGATTRLATWVARTADIHAAASASPIPLGRIEPMTRGPLRWLVTVPEDGSLPTQGIAPTLIQWLNEPHPANRLADSGCALARLEGFHSEAERIGTMLRAIRFAGGLTVSRIAPHETPFLVAHIQTPNGIRRLGGPE
jgi:Glyoxalase-like domain